MARSRVCACRGYEGQFEDIGLDEGQSCPLRGALTGPSPAASIAAACTAMLMLARQADDTTLDYWLG